MVTSDAPAGLKKALAARLPGVPWRRCQFHLAHDAMAYVPKPSMREAVGASLRAIFDAPDRTEAERQLENAVKKHRSSDPRMADSLEVAVPEGLSVFGLPSLHRRRLRTSSMLERLGEEIKRRTRVTGLFPNESSAPRLVSAVLMEIGEEWETNHRFLCMEPD